MDRVSDLPDDVIDLILERLPAIDRVKTSILSRRLRFRRRGFFTRLILDKKVHSSVFKRFRRHTAQPDYGNIVESIVLQQGGGGSLKEFSLYVHDADRKSCEAPYQRAVHHVVTNNSGLELLRLSGSSSSTWSSIYSVNLRHLEITSLIFKPPCGFEGFPKLTSLVLKKTMVAADKMSGFISSCPQLARIAMIWVIFIGRDLDLIAPGLTDLWLVGRYMNLSFSNPQNLKCIGLVFQSQSNVYAKGMFRYLNRSLQLQHIELNDVSCQWLGKFKAIHMLPRYDQMTSLIFSSVNLGDPAQLCCPLKFCACSPNVRELYLKTLNSLIDPTTEPPELQSMATEHIKEDFGKLVKVKLVGIGGLKVEMKIIELLLNFSPILELMDIVFDPQASEYKETTVMNFHRASTQANINFTHA